MRPNQKIWALYKGDEYIYCGTIKEIANKLNITETTVRFYKSKVYKKRRKGSTNCLMLYEIKGDLYE